MPSSCTPFLQDCKDHGADRGAVDGSAAAEDVDAPTTTAEID
jgi:hypothetical protein